MWTQRHRPAPSVPLHSVPLVIQPAPAERGHAHDVKAMIAFAQETFGPLDILVNNAGVVEALSTQRTSFPDIEPERWLRMLDVNLRGVLLGTHYAIDAMRGRAIEVIDDQPVPGFDEQHPPAVHDGIG